jgi:Fe-S-cluster containining protein
MLLDSAFSYQCQQCGQCCRDKVITLSPYDVIRIARACGISTGEALQRFTVRRGMMLRFREDGRCAALDGLRCSIHAGRPLACRVYPLGIQWQPSSKNEPEFVALEPARGSTGIYGSDGTVASFLQGQDVQPYLAALESYRELFAAFHDRIAELVDFERIEPAEFRRCAIREAMAELGYDPNPLIDALFDADSVSRGIADSGEGIVARHVTGLRSMVERETNAGLVAAAGTMLAVSLGYPPTEILPDWQVQLAARAAAGDGLTSAWQAARRWPKPSESRVAAGHSAPAGSPRRGAPGRPAGRP